MTTNNKQYMCWRALNKRCSHTQPLLKEELVKRIEDINHIDYCCPECCSVIICNGEINIPSARNPF